jgi:hypothetical protein
MSVETGFYYTHWNFDAESKSSYISVPLRMTAQPFKNLSMEVTIPYVYQKNVSVISIGGHAFSGTNGQGMGSPSRNQQGSSQGAGLSLENLPANNQIKKGPPSNDNPSVNNNNNSSGNNNNDKDETNKANIQSTKNISESENGLGDIYLLFSSDFQNFFNRFPNYVPTPDIYAGIKLPTADDAKGLGTGKYDYTLGLTLNWDWGRAGCYLFGDYTWVGDMEDENFKNISCFGAGANVDLTQKMSILIDLSGCTALYPDVSSHFSLQIGIKRNIYHQYWIQSSGLVGLNKRSPDYGFGLSFGKAF